MLVLCLSRDRLGLIGVAGYAVLAVFQVRNCCIAPSCPDLWVHSAGAVPSGAGPELQTGLASCGSCFAPLSALLLPICTAASARVLRLQQGAAEATSGAAQLDMLLHSRHHWGLKSASHHACRAPHRSGWPIGSCACMRTRQRWDATGVQHGVVVSCCNGGANPDPPASSHRCLLRGNAGQLL